jgi:hypothetical protein
MPRGSVSVIKSVDQAHAFYWLLLNAVQHVWRSDLRGLIDGRDDIDHVTELGAQAALIFDAGGPRNHHAIAAAAKVRGDLFRPLHGRVHRVRPADWIMVVGAWSA